MRQQFRGSLFLVLFIVANLAHARFPQTVDQARAEYAGRRDDILEVYVQLTSAEPLSWTECKALPNPSRGREGPQQQCITKSHPFGNFKEHGSTRSFRRMAAWLIAYKKHFLKTGDYGDVISKPAGLGNAPSVVADWTKGIAQYAPAGTDWGQFGGADYDMVLKEMITFLYLFKNEPQLMTNDAAYRIIDQGLKYRGNNWEVHMRYKFRVILFLARTYPETENHVLMTLSSMYLTNQWIYNNPRNDPRLTKGAYAKREAFKNSAAFETILLQTMGRIVHSDYFETNARPYQTFTFHSLFNLYLFADSATIRAAAKNAIDFTATKFAFQSFEGKRLVPQRRQSEHRESMSMYENDGVSFMMGMLSGFYAFNDTVRIKNGKIDPESYFPASYTGNALGHMLWAALASDRNLVGDRAYTVPRPIHGFMLRKRGGFWARMQARFGDHNMKGGHWPRYFEDGKTTEAWIAGDFEFAPELYYGTAGVFNVAGGKFNNYPLDSPTDAFVYDFTGKPSFIMPAGHVRDWGEGTAKMAQDTMLLTSGKGTDANNIGTFKGLTWGYPTLSVPPTWTPSTYQLNLKAPHGTIQFKFYDLTHPNKQDGYYVVAGTVSVASTMPPVVCAILSASCAPVTSAFWELIPAPRFPSLSALESAVTAAHKDADFDDSHIFYRYNSTTGETLELYKDAGRSNVGGLGGIVAPDGTRLAVKDYHVDTAGGGRGMPLIEVFELDARGLFTGRRFVWSGGDGKVEVWNPWEGEEDRTLCIDSWDYRYPQQTRVCPST